MAQVQDSFTLRLLQRASRRAEALDSNREALQRKMNIIRAIRVDQSILKSSDFNNNVSSFVLSEDSVLPIMESTRKIPRYSRTSATFDGPEEVASPEEVQPEREYNAENFLYDALGDEINNTSVTFAGSSGWNKSNSDFCASDLVSLDDESRADVEVLALPLKPRSSSTLNRSARLEFMTLKSDSEAKKRFPKLRSVFKLVQKLVRNTKRVVQLTSCK